MVFLKLPVHLYKGTPPELEMLVAAAHFTQEEEEYRKENLCHCLTRTACVFLLLVNSFPSMSFQLSCEITFKLKKGGREWCVGESSFTLFSKLEQQLLV